MSRSRRTYAIGRIRLLAFHNFIDETIELRDGGHLFLLGDNGSGKTTALDAIHYVLSGGEGVELNAAARVGGRRGEGRTLQGVVLRYDAERGVMNEGGGVAYAALELWEKSGDGTFGDHRLCLGIGFEATTMDARVRRWGFLTPRSLEELELTETTEEGTVVLGREAMRERLPKGETFGQIADYRKAVATKLYGGPNAYEEVTGLWSMAKAYREIVAKARDFAGLFERLLPGPDVEVLSEILASFRDLEDLEAKLRSIEAQQVYIGAVAALLADVRTRREELARYAFLAADWTREVNATAIAGSEQAVKRLTLALDRARAEAAGMSERRERAERALRDAEAADEENLGGQLRRARRALEEREQRADSADVERRLAEREAHEGAGAARRAAETHRGLLEVRVDRARQVFERAVDLPGALARTRAFIEEAGSGAARPDAVRDELDQWAGEREEARRSAGDERAASAAALAAAAERVDALESQAEPEPPLHGFAEAREALRREGIEAEPLYARLVPRRGASDYRLGALESLIGLESLAALVVPADDRSRARSVVEATAPGVRVLARVADVPWPEWVRDLVDTDEETARAVGAAIADAVAGEARAPDPTGGLEHRGLVFRPRHARPRWIGAEARERERQRLLDEARAELAERQRVLDEAQARERSAARALDAARRLIEAITAFDAREVAQAREAEVRAVAEADAARSHLERETARVARLREEAREAREVAEALQARADAMDLAEIERRVAELRERARQRRAESDAAHAAVGARQSELAAERERLAAAEARAPELEERVAARAEELRALVDEAVADDEALRDYVYVRQRGRQFQSLEAIEDRRRTSGNAEAALVAELQGDGGRGVRNLQYAGQFGLTFDPRAATVEDRRRQPLANVRADLERTLDEQRSVVNDKTRALMDQLVMRNLVQELQGQLERLRTTIRDINRLLGGLRFGRTRYRFKVAPARERRELVELVSKVNLLDQVSQERFKAFVTDRLDELAEVRDGEIPELLDYRRWHTYGLTMKTLVDGEVNGEADGEAEEGPAAASGDVELSQTLRRVGSGGEQGVPNYLLVLALASLVFRSSRARLTPLLFDEAFYGIDAGRREELLRFATELGLQLVVASPDQDGATPAAQRATTLFLVKDPYGDVHLAPYHYWQKTQAGLFDAPPDDAEAVVSVGD